MKTTSVSRNQIQFKKNLVKVSPYFNHYLIPDRIMNNVLVAADKLRKVNGNNVIVIAPGFFKRTYITMDINSGELGKLPCKTPTNEVFCFVRKRAKGFNESIKALFNRLPYIKNKSKSTNVEDIIKASKLTLQS